MPEYKFTYFNARGLGELSRLLFKVSGREFTDDRVQGEQWTNMKDEMPLKALPVLTIDGGMKVCQSHAIARYLAREFGLMGSNNNETLQMEVIEETLVEMFQRELNKIFNEKDENKKKELAIAFEKEASKKYIDFIQRCLAENNGGKGFFVGDKLSYADILVYDAFTMLKSFLGKFDVVDILKNRPLLQAHFDRIGAVPSIAAWVKARPVTEF